MFNIFMSALVSVLILLGQGPAATAQEARTAAGSHAQAKPAESVEAINAAVVHGPAKVALNQEATLALPDGMGFIPKVQAAALLRKSGTFPGDSLIGVIFPETDDAHWMMVVNYTDAGYVKDDESDKIDEGELLASFRASAAETNKKREAVGIDPMEVTGWSEKPRYEAATHRLIWSLEVQKVGNQDPDRISVNFNTRVLGRDGYFSLDMVAGRHEIDACKPIVDQLLGGLTFGEGKHYEDYNAKTDKTAKYGLIALIGGIAAHKLGMFAIAAAFFAKSVKLILLSVAGALAGFKRFFRRKRGGDPS